MRSALVRLVAHATAAATSLAAGRRARWRARLDLGANLLACNEQIEQRGACGGRGRTEVWTRTGALVNSARDRTGLTRASRVPVRYRTVEEAHTLIVLGECHDELLERVEIEPRLVPARAGVGHVRAGVGHVYALCSAR